MAASSSQITSPKKERKEKFQIETRYLTVDNLNYEIHVQPEDLLRTDNYNETELKTVYENFSNENIILFQKVAIHLAIIGFGNKSFGGIKHNGKELKIVDVLKKLKINPGGLSEAKLAENEFTPRRMIRFSRFMISQFIKEYNYPSYLWTKYADKTRAKNMFICFPGAEHLVEEEKQAIFLYETYAQLDHEKNSKISDRIHRVFQARGINLNIEE